MTLLLSTLFLVAAQDDPAPKAESVDIAKFVPTREPKNIPADLRTPGPFDDEYPIPQDKAAAASRRAARLAWAKATFLQGYAESAKADAPWFAKGKAALEAVAAFEAAANPLDSRVLDPVVEQTRLALLAECDHPLVQLAAFPHHGLAGEGPTGFSPEYANAVMAMLAGPYHPAVKANEAWQAAVRQENARPNAAQAKDFYGAFWTHFIALAKSKEPHDQAEVLKLADRVHHRYVQLNQKRLDGWNALKAAFEQANAEAYVRLVAEADFRIAYADDANRAKTDDAKKLVAERIAQARKLLADAWTADGKRPESATRMLRVCLRDAAATREEMEQWFARAMTADPDNFLACQIKLEWFARPAERNEKSMVTFGRQCVRTANHDAFLGRILFLAHQKIAATSTKDNYFGTSEPWADVRELFETRLKAIPDCRYSRTVWGLHCLNAGEGPGALHNLLAVRKNPWTAVVSAANIESAIGRARALAKEQQEMP